MHKPTRTLLHLLVLTLLLAGVVRAEHETTAPASPQTAPATRPAPAPAAPQEAPKPGEPADKVSVTDHQITINGQPLKYQARAGQLVIRTDDGKPKAEMFFVAYDRQPSEDPATRPITFVFNGGPGAAAVWMHLGTAGPMRLALNDNGDAPAPPFSLEENQSTWLAATDLVFIDPVGTGYSRAAPGEKPEQFFGVEEDIRSVADFIRLYITRYERWPSPKFLAGESYGTTRAAALANHLLNERGIALNGVILISSVLNFQTISPGATNDLPFALYLPTYTAIAWYHKKLPPDLQADLHKALGEVERWAMHDYLAALAAGRALSEEQRSAIADSLSRFTGLSSDYLKKANLRIDPGGFRKELLAGSRQLIGRFDARITGYNPDPLDREASYDPSLTPYLAAYSATFNEYVRRSLKYESDRQYDALSGKVGPWNFGEGGFGYLSVAERLRNAILGNTRMQVLFASGYYDLATPYLSASYTIDHLDLGPELAANIKHTFYDGGHMLYHYRPSLQRLGQDVTSFISGAVARPK